MNIKDVINTLWLFSCKQKMYEQADFKFLSKIFSIEQACSDWTVTSSISFLSLHAESTVKFFIVLTFRTALHSHIKQWAIANKAFQGE